VTSKRLRNVAVRAIYQAGTFTPAEREIISLTNAVEHGATYCHAIHSTFALKQGVPAEPGSGAGSHCPPANVKISRHAYPQPRSPKA